MPIPAECPGSKFIKQPIPREVECPVCGNELEVWSDELCTECPKCKTNITSSGAVENSCVHWCEYAEKCVGTELYDKIKGTGK